MWIFFVVKCRFYTNFRFIQIVDKKIRYSISIALVLSIRSSRLVVVVVVVVLVSS